MAPEPVPNVAPEFMKQKKAAATFYAQNASAADVTPPSKGTKSTKSVSGDSVDQIWLPPSLRSEANRLDKEKAAAPVQPRASAMPTLLSSRPSGTGYPTPPPAPSPVQKSMAPTSPVPAAPAPPIRSRLM